MSESEREQIVRLEEEVLRLRDLLMGQERELADLRGRAAQAEARSARLVNALRGIQQRVPRLPRTVAASVIARLRG